MFKTSGWRRGAVAVLVALSLVALLGIAAIALDGGLLLDERRQVQAAADAAALAAAMDLYNNYPTNNGQDVGGTASASAFSVAAANSYKNDGKSSVVTVNIPPASGSYAGKAGYAEVSIQFNQQRFFSAIFGSGNIPVTARAVARGQLVSSNKGIILLNPTSQGALNAVGNPIINVTSGAIVVDSNNAAAATLSGNAQISAPAIDFSGSPGYSLSGGAGFSPTTVIVTNQNPTPDPFRFLPTPTRPTVQSPRTLNISAGNVTLNPGTYIGGIKITDLANVTLNPGLYYMQGGVGFYDIAKGTLSGSGVTIYNDNSGGSINIAGQGQITLSPPTSGPYQHITIFQNPSASATVSVTGNGNMNITGIFYAAAATLNITATGTNNNIGSHYVSRNLNITGNGDITISYASTTSPKFRAIGLVE